MQNLKEWIESNLGSVEPLRSIHEHLDAYDWKSMSPSEISALCRDILIELLDSSLIEIEKFSLLFVLPLKSTDRLADSLPDIDQLTDELDDYTPPAIYIRDRNDQLFSCEVEEYLVTLPSLGWSHKNYHIKVYYRSFRIEGPWATDEREYVRCMYWEVFPEHLVG